MSEIPLKVRVDIRDKWDKADSQVNKAVESLSKNLGLKVVPIVEWAAIWGEIGELYSDKANFVPTISGIVLAWYERLQARLDDDNYAEWSEQLTNILTELPHRDIRLYVESRGKTIKRPTTTWDKRKLVFTIGIPHAQSIAISQIISGFDRDFTNMFVPESATIIAVREEAAKDDEWAEVISTSDVRSIASVAPTPSMSGPSIRPFPEHLPSAYTIPRPEDHFKLTTPYILTLDYVRSQSIIIQCSHQGSLELINEYFSKWLKKSQGDTRFPTVLRLDLRESHFCYGVSDTLIIEPYYKNSYQINPTLILAFIEGTLGYQLIHTDGSNWIYRCDRVLK